MKFYIFDRWYYHCQPKSGRVPDVHVGYIGCPLKALEVSCLDGDSIEYYRLYPESVLRIIPQGSKRKVNTIEFAHLQRESHEDS